MNLDTVIGTFNQHGPGTEIGNQRTKVETRMDSVTCALGPAWREVTRSQGLERLFGEGYLPEA